MIGTTIVQVVPKGGSGVDPAILEMLGKKAANLYLDRGVKLTDAVVKVASAETAAGQQFTTEHLRRITEFANTSTNQALFEKEADKTFAFPLANPEAVIQSLRDGAVNKIPVPSSRDAVESAMPKMASVGDYFPGSESVRFEDFFGTPSGEEYPQLNPTAKLAALSDRLQGVEEEILSKKTGVEILSDNVREEIFQHIKQASLYGLTLGDIYGALRQVAENEKTAQALCTEAHERLGGEVHYQLQDQAEKTASGIINDAHPLVKAFQSFEKLSHQLRILTKAAEIAGEQRSRADRLLRDRLRHAQSAPQG